MLEIGAQVLRGNLLQMVSPSASERGVGSQNVIHLLGSTVHHLLSVPLREEALRTGTRGTGNLNLYNIKSTLYINTKALLFCLNLWRYPSNRSYSERSRFRSPPRRRSPPRFAFLSLYYTCI